MRLQIRYRTDSNEVTERTISDVVLDPPYQIQAFCHLRNAGRTFAPSRIEKAIDLDSGELISDIFTFFGLQSQESPRLTMPVFSGKPQPMSIEEAQLQRKADKHSLFHPFVHLVIAEAVKAKLYRLFGNQCFKCANPRQLEMDHHIPQYLGGRLWPGNIVLLCNRCNSAKGIRHPQLFYSPEQLARLDDIFEKQLDIFTFKFDRRKWDRDRKGYLLAVGVSQEDVEHALNDTESPFYVGTSQRRAQ